MGSFPVEKYCSAGTEAWTFLQLGLGHSTMTQVASALGVISRAPLSPSASGWEGLQPSLLGATRKGLVSVLWTGGLGEVNQPVSKGFL